MTTPSPQSVPDLPTGPLQVGAPKNSATKRAVARWQESLLIVERGTSPAAAWAHRDIDKALLSELSRRSCRQLFLLGCILDHNRSVGEQLLYALDQLSRLG